MKRFAPIAAIALGSLLLVGCESEDVARIARNQHTCALLSAGSISWTEASERIGLEGRRGVAYCRSLMPGRFG